MPLINNFFGLEQGRIMKKRSICLKTKFKRTKQIYS